MDGCPALAIKAVEARTSTTERAKGSLSARVHTCSRHYGQWLEQIINAGMTPFTPPHSRANVWRPHRHRAVLPHSHAAGPQQGS